MVRFSLIQVLLAIAPVVFAQATPVRWMPLGDSITDYGCWRAWIWERFQKEGSNVDLVGGERAGENCNGLNFDRDHEGVSQSGSFAAVTVADGWYRSTQASWP
jgi:hypothetical protein